LQGVRYALQRPHLVSPLVLQRSQLGVVETSAGALVTWLLRRRPCLAPCLVTEQISPRYAVEEWWTDG
jgi:hypothetical protein